jgi:gliding motility-associated-like protein
MKWCPILYVLVVSFLLLQVKAFCQSTSNQGTEFWVPFPTHIPDIDVQGNFLDAKLSIFITGPEPSSGTLVAGTFSQHFSVAANQVVEIKVPRANAYIDEAEAGQVLANRSVHIVVDPGSPKIVVYAHIFAGRRSAASLVLPKETLGNNYYSMNFWQYYGVGKNYITIIATEPDTRVFLKKKGADLVPGGIYLPNANDVYEYLVTDDLTGVSITGSEEATACKRFAVFSGSSGVKIGIPGCTPNSFDPLFQQCYPVLSWGTQYGFVPFSMTRPNGSPTRTAGQYIRVVAKEAQTKVMFNDKLVATLNEGEFYETFGPVAVPTLISASAPVAVAEFPPAQSCANIDNSEDPKVQGYSDPDMVILNPIEFNIKNITVYSSTRENISEQYINVLIKTSAASSFKINGALPQGAFQDFTPLPGYSYLQLNLNNYPINTFNLTAADGFNAIAYGFGDLESYAYSAGTNLASTQSITAVNTATGADIDFACVDENYYFKLTLPFIASKIDWKMDQQENPVTQIAPAYNKVLKNAVASYEYIFPKTAAYANPGFHLISIDAQYPAGGTYCDSGSEIIQGIFKVIGGPDIKIQSTRVDCNNEYQFVASTETADPIKSWVWDFGDQASGTANHATGKNISHNFTSDGIYQVSITAISETGCQATLYYSLSVPKNIESDFNAPGQACINEPILLQDLSKVYGNNLASRIWDFGDGSAITVTDEASVSHQFSTPGLFKVTVTLMSDLGCIIGRLDKEIRVYAKPDASFTYPANCLADALLRFTNTSNEITSDGQQVNYTWDFGDAMASGNNQNTSHDKSPGHRYPAAGVYQVSLTATTAAGCSNTIVVPVTVNGIQPQAAFDITNNSFCGGEPVFFTDRSFVADFGSITKIEWIFDALNHPDIKETFNNPPPGKTYQHTYPRFSNAPFTREFTVTLNAYSGSVCINSVSHTVSSSASPVVMFDAMPIVCSDDAPFKLVAANETTGIPGDGGLYSGPGVTADGFFDPSLAGAGKHIINYTFNSRLGCAVMATNTLTVLAQPKVTMPTTQIIPSGSGEELKPSYSGDNLSYSWSPTEGLDNPHAAYPYATPTRDIIYTVSASNGVCSTEGSVSVMVFVEPVVTNSFTPNGDGVNDNMQIKYLENYPTATIDIYNRYGALITHIIGNSKPWDGKYHGSYVPFGVYYYVINLGKGKKPRAGYVTVIR